MRTAVGLTCLLLVTGCTTETTATSGSTEFTETTDGTRLIEPGFRTVLQVDLRSDTSDAYVTQFTEKYRKFGGVESAGGGGGEGVFNAMITFSADAKEDEVVAVRKALSKESKASAVAARGRSRAVQGQQVCSISASALYSGCVTVSSQRFLISLQSMA